MRKITKQILVTTLMLGVLFLPSVNAQTLDFSKLVAVSEDVAPEDRFLKKVELTSDALDKASGRVAEMQEKLVAISLEEGTPEQQLLGELITRANEYADFYTQQAQRLDEVTTIEEVDALIDEIIAYRESVYAPGAKEILEFVLVYSYTPSVLDLANERLESIRTDVNKLEGLGLVETGAFQSDIAEAEKTLQEARDLHGRAVTMLLEDYAASLLEPVATSTPELATTTEEMTLAVITPKSLAEESLAKIKSLYELFMATGERVNQTLGIGS